ncbi:MAG TPA: PhzF family phenazine biosynthesis protein [Alphaproteobacteria bacterium]|jgi:trans-2,3-dihydro-3-hydroxyanthranilate isomerase|nr:PhzF family phenazine biosynthesis protein [Alphaproteobacteria bacterium]
MTHRFTLIDVFTEQAFGGNQLAVFPDGTGISDRLMQSYARELNFSETTFVLPPRKPGHTHRVRIFTPTKEIPFAGHPNVGTAVVLAAAGHSGDLVFDEDVGTVRITAQADGNRGFAELTLEGGAEVRPSDIPSARLAEMLSLPEEKIGPRPAFFASVGLPFFVVPLADQESVAAAKLHPVWETLLPPGQWSRDIYIAARNFSPGGRLKVRMFAPADGVPEDPATGSAAAALAGSLAASVPESDGEFAWTIEQGAEIGRPSLITATAVKRAGQVTAVRVGGSAVIVGEGAFNL